LLHLARILVRLLLRLLFRFRIEGLERFPPGPAVVVANHPSALDPMFIAAALPERVLFIAAAEFLSLRIVGWVMRAYGCIPVRRGEADSTAIREAMAVLAAGVKVGVFPEGRVSPQPGLLRRGAALIAGRAQVPVLPVAVLGSDRVFPLGARWPRLARVTVRFGPPLPASGPGRDAQEAVVEEAMAWVRAQVAGG
jgi:1-acyl-sn-glycerol-3-phosphate acyltransferase